ncbi:MAG TPA: AMP-binding protein [Stellaceae bacterium]|nr:AMP-binding protein [Stellaceae bacterium]
MLIGDIPRAAAARFGDKPAVIAPDRTLRFAELDGLADRFAAALAARGVAPGDRVTLYGENGWAWIIAYYGIARAGAVINPVNALLTDREVRFVMEDCGARTVVVSAVKAARLSDALADRPADMIVYGGSLPGTTGFEDLLAAAEPRPPPLADRSADGLSTICYTSGTTGYPKGAMLSHRAVCTNVRMTSVMHGRHESDVVVTALPCPHVYGNVVMNASVLTGATLVLFPSFEADAIVAAIVRHRATVFEGVPTMYHYLLQRPALAEADLSSLRLCTVGGQTMPVAAMRAVEARMGCPLIELWGMTELAGLGTTHPHAGPYRLGSIGVALPFVETRIADIDDPARTLGEGEVGELLVRGPIVMQGYYGRPEATAEAITADGWLRSGDLARRDTDGFIHIADRKKDVILTAGYNIYPAELERTIAAHPAVAMVAVVGIPDAVKGEVPRAFVVLKAGAAATEDDMLLHCRAELAPYKIPRSVRFVEDLPKTSTGKVLRRALRADSHPDA